MEYKCQLPWGWATGGDISPDGDEILIRGYNNASLWPRLPGTNLWDAFSQSPVSVPLRSEPQGEAIGFDSDGWGYFTVSEGTYQPIYYFDRVPEPVSIVSWQSAANHGDLVELLLVDGAGFYQSRHPVIFLLGKI